MSPRKIAPRLELVVGLGLGFGLGGGQFYPGAIVLEPFLKYAKLCKRQQMLKTYDNLKVGFV